MKRGSAALLLHKGAPECLSAVLLNPRARSPLWRCSSKTRWAWVPHLGDLRDPATGTRERDCPVWKNAAGGWGAGKGYTGFLSPSCSALFSQRKRKKAGKVTRRKREMQ